MLNTPHLSKNQCALLEKYLQEKIGQEQNTVGMLKRRTAGTVTPLSLTQQQMWVLAQLVPDVPVYNESAVVHLPGPLDTTALGQSLNEVIRRHEVWRTTFPLVNGQPVQVVHPSLTLELPVVDLRHLPVPERERHAVQLATAQATLLFDLTKLPLLRATLIRLADEEHRLYLTLHHILCDGVIYAIFLPELYTHYQAFVSNRPSPLPPLPIQYGDFALWQRERLQTPEFAAHMAYWKRQLASAPISLELPTDRPYPAVMSHRGARLPFSLPANLVAALKSLSYQENATLYQTLVASFSTLLYRYTGQTDMLLGTTTAGCKPLETRELLGAFINTLVLRPDLSGNPTFRELLRRVRDVVLEAHANQEVPFDALVAELQPARTLRQHPLIQVMISLNPPSPVFSSGWTITQADVEMKTAKFDLFLGLDERSDGFVARLEYNTDIFEESTAWRMVGHWQTLLQSIVADPSMPIAALPLLTSAERELLQVQWNDTTVAYPQDHCLHRCFESQARQTPAAVAVVFAQGQLTYQELNRQANQLAHRLQRAGIKPDTLVGVYMERSLEMVVSLLAVLKAGGAYVPLDPIYPQARLAYMIQDAQVPVLLTQSHLLACLPDSGATIITVNPGWNATIEGQESNLASATQPDHLAYMIYTSGSTGNPKGVMNTHRGICNRLHWMQHAYQLTHEDRVLQKTPFSFDVSVWEFFWPLITGATLVVARPGGHQDPAYIASMIETQHITTLHFVPSMLKAFLLEAKLEQRCRSLKRVICSGEALPVDLQELFFARFPAPVQLYNLYGPTEAAIEVTAWQCRRNERRVGIMQTCGVVACVPCATGLHRVGARHNPYSSADLVPIGYPIANTQIYILNPAGQPAPIGVPGELYIGGVGVARGYHNQPELTAEKFVRDPFSNNSQARLFKTGDLARYRSDGAIEFLGRIDHQVKIRGVRIELGEIEVTLRHHPAVHDAVVVAHEANPGDTRLIAYLVPAQNQGVVSALQEHVTRNLPAFMLPSTFVWLDALPLTPNGKVDRRALPAPDLAKRTSEDSFVPPVSMIHHLLCQIWEDLLNIRPIGIKDNFFYIGGHSLLAARLVDRIEQVFGKRLPLTTLFASPTIEQLACALQTEGMMRAPVVAVRASGSKKPFFFLHEAWESGAFYCFQLARHLTKDQPFYALAPYQFEEGEVIPTLEEIATKQLRSICTMQSEGPYLLGGFCNGAILAYEIARQLYAQGQRVERLILIDPACPPALHMLAYNVINFIGHRFGFTKQQQGEVFLRVRHTFKYLMRQRKNVADLNAFRDIDPSILTLVPTTSALLQDHYGLFDWMRAEYSYEPYSDNITIIWAEQEPFHGLWRRKAAQESTIEVQFVPGTHVSCRIEYVQYLGEALERCLFSSPLPPETAGEKKKRIQGDTP
jgi:amino acid adenylation domain-containing protein